MDALAPFNTARRALANIDTPLEAIELADKAQAAMVYCKRAKLGVDNYNRAAEVKILAEWKAGELLAAMDKRHGGKKPALELRDVIPLLADLGIEPIQSHRWQRLADIPLEEIETHLAETKEAGKEITTAAVMRLRAPASGKSAADSGADDAPWPLHKALGELSTAIERICRRWPTDEMDTFSARLRSLADELDSTGGIAL